MTKQQAVRAIALLSAAKDHARDCDSNNGRNLAAVIESFLNDVALGGYQT